MPHPLVIQHRFTRSEFKRGLVGLTDAEARRRFEPINSISWMIMHLAWQEQRYWLTRAQGITLLPQVNELAANGGPPSTPPLDEAWHAWETIVAAGEPYLDSLTSATMSDFMIVKGRKHPENIGAMLRRTTYHYWYHLGESQAVRQLLGHTNLPEFVGAIGDEAPYVPETD